MNLISVQVRAIAWHIVLNQALPPPHPRHRHVFSAFCVGLLGNAVLPGRVGEVARVAVMAKHVPNGGQTWGTILGSIVAHRLFDVIPTIGLVIWVLVAARIPGWALPGVEIILGIGALLIVGSFLNVVIHRLPRGESIWWPGSHCPSCGRAVSPRDNVPLLSWLWLRGRCRACGVRISPRYPAIELATGLVFAAIALRHGASAMTLVWLAFAAALIAAAAIDYDHRIIPDEISLGGLAAIAGAFLLGGAASTLAVVLELLLVLAGLDL